MQCTRALRAAGKPAPKSGCAVCGSTITGRCQHPDFGPSSARDWYEAGHQDGVEGNWDPPPRSLDVVLTEGHPGDARRSDRQKEVVDLLTKMRVEESANLPDGPDSTWEPEHWEAWQKVEVLDEVLMRVKVGVG